MYPPARVATGRRRSEKRLSKAVARPNASVVPYARMIRKAQAGRKLFNVHRDFCSQRDLCSQRAFCSHRRPATRRPWGKLFNVPCAGDRAYDTCVWYAKAPWGRKLFNVQRIMIILKDLITILRIKRILLHLTTFLQLCVVNADVY